MTFYKRLLKLIPVLVVLVILPRVASFVQRLGPGDPVHTFISWAFALVLGLGTIATAYFSDETRAPNYEEEPTTKAEERRREKERGFYAAMLQAAPYAKFAMVIFAGLDGAFNLADALLGASANGLFDVENHDQALIYVYFAATILFGISPTILNVMLVRVVSMVDRIPDFKTVHRAIDWTRTLIGNLGLKEYRYRSGNRTKRTKSNKTKRSVRSGGIQTERVKQALEQIYAEHGVIAGVTDLLNAMDDPPAKSTISVARKQWLEENGIN